MCRPGPILTDRRYEKQPGGPGVRHHYLPGLYGGQVPAATNHCFFHTLALKVLPQVFLCFLMYNGEWVFRTLLNDLCVQWSLLLAAKGWFLPPLLFITKTTFAMQHQCRLLYARMCRDLQACVQNERPWQQEVERCFQVAEGHWAELQKRTCTYRFGTPEQEIGFFKYGKPLFTAEIIYYTLCYNAFLFQPLQSSETLSFWRREHGRLQRFIEENGRFYHYYKEGQTHLDATYFLRKNFDPQNSLYAKVYDAEPAACTNKDPQVATILALERYAGFTKGVTLQLLTWV